jgi:hypothetical protein
LTCTTVRTLKGPVYEQKFAEFIITFGDRRKDLQLALTIHVSLGIDTANISMGRMETNVQSMQEKMDRILKMFQE